MKTLISLIILFIFLSNCDSKSSVKNTVEFQKKCQDSTSISKDVAKKMVDTISFKFKSDPNDDDIGWHFMLHDINEFEEMFNNPCKYKEPLLELLSDSLETSAQKSIIIYSLQKQCINQYVEVVEKGYFFYKKGSLSQNQFIRIIEQYGWSNEVYKNYDNPRLVKVLEKVSEDKTFEKKYCESVKKILSGEVWKYLDNFYTSQDQARPWTCN